MAKDFAGNFYVTIGWKKCRAAYYKYAGGLCERCLRNGIITPGRIVHHKIHLTPDNINDPAVTYNFDNLELLCDNCHAAEHVDDVKTGYFRYRKRAKKARYRIDENGTVII